MIYFFSYGDDNYKLSKQRILKEATELNIFDKCNVYSPDDIDKDFKNKYKEIFEYKRGNGYWIWKFYFIKKYLDEVNEGDIIVYCDAGCQINKSGKQRLKEYIDMLKISEEGVISFQLDENIENQWTIKEIFDYFNIDINDKNAINGQYIGGIFIYKKCEKSLSIINKCLELLEYDKYLITDKYVNTQNYTKFKENRHDQSIHSLARKIYGSIVLSGTEVETGDTKYPFNARRIRG